jgi:hypothetical protein
VNSVTNKGSNAKEQSAANKKYLTYGRQYHGFDSEGGRMKGWK